MELTIAQLNKFYDEYQDYREYSRDSELMEFGEFVQSEINQQSQNDDEYYDRGYSEDIDDEDYER